MFENLIKKYFVLTDIELNPGAGGQRVGVDQIAGIDYEVVKQAFGAAGSLTLVSPADPLPVTDAVAEAALTSLAAEDFATQTTLAALLAKVIAAPSTEAKQDAIIALLNSIDAGTAAALGQALMAASVPVVIASNQSAIPVSGTITTGGLTDAQLRATAVPVTDSTVAGKSATATLSNVADSATNVTLLASNANRLGATIFNDSTEILYVKFGATASTTSFTVKMNPQAYYELPFRYTGIIDGIWAANASGSARITELTP